MPAVAKTSDAEIVRAARKLVERSGADALSMQAVAQAVGVQAPSLYKRFAARDALLDAVLVEALDALREALVEAGRGKPPARALAAMAGALRAVGRRSPHMYKLLLTGGTPDGEAVARARQAAVAPVFTEVQALVAPAHVLDAARALTAFVHGFVSMETAGAFRLGGDVERAFHFGVQTLLGALGKRRR